MRSFRSNRASGGEALIVSVVIAGFFWLMSTGEFQVQDIWGYAGFLAIIVVFYFALLLCRMMFFHMVGGNGNYPWWAIMDEEKLKSMHHPRKNKKK